MYYFYRQVCNYRKWLKKLNWALRGFFPIHFCVTCQALPNVSSLYHPAEFSIFITECCQLKLEIIRSCTHTLLYSKLFHPPRYCWFLFFTTKEAQYSHERSFFPILKSSPAKKRNTIKSPPNIFYFLKGGEDLPSDLLMTFYCTRQQHCIWKHKTSLRTFLASGLKWLFWH